MQTNMDFLAANILRHLKARKKNLQDLAQMAGISKSVVSDIVNGHANPTLGTLEKIATALGTTVIDLLSEEGARTAPKGYEYVYALVDKFCATQIRAWEAVTKKKLGE